MTSKLVKPDSGVGDIGLRLKIDADGNVIVSFDIPKTTSSVVEIEMIGKYLGSLIVNMASELSTDIILKALEEFCRKEKRSHLYNVVVKFVDNVYLSKDQSNNRPAIGALELFGIKTNKGD